MVSKKTRKNRQKADIRLAIHLLAMRQMNLTTSVNDALLAMWQRIDDLQKEVEKLKEDCNYEAYKKRLEAKPGRRAGRAGKLYGDM